MKKKKNFKYFFIVAYVQLWALDTGISISGNDAQYILKNHTSSLLVIKQAI